MNRPKGYVQLQAGGDSREEDSVYTKIAQERAKLLCMRLPSRPLPDWKILDIGCYRGEAIRVFKSQRPELHITGLDIVPDNVDEAMSVADEAVVGDCHQLPFEDKSFDWVFSQHTLEHCYDIPKAVSEMRRVSRRGIFLALPLEGQEKYDATAGHFFHTLEPMHWLNLVDHRDWLLVSMSLTQYSDIIVVLLRKELVEYGK